ncbi:ABC transporter ATP-binding protein [Xiamenia xianingshaonis]|uniref:ABC transporter ATP-binding protein n=1 Tax=Xiamenia xianingshaonis TaxID=2682776 RepID=A0A9E6MPW8_9ACTN|nr:ABC transporter ATP-binding protein [Xiamenia xianingshaonis]NHM14172.1 ATP-binding cassette domain-containing protein [Xiamenia xianingshaonis]QTU84213.1 ABC transporter ATP-binding protein [Xiamenia xianingshaonis]
MTESHTHKSWDQASQARLRVSRLVLSWGEEAICQDVSFSVNAGELVCLVGRSGSGKTTLFHAVAGLTVPDGGSIFLDGRDITGRAGEVSYMLQKDLLLPQHTILENVAMPLLIAKVPRKRAFATARESFATFGLEGTEGLYPSQLSGGMRQRAALLRTYLMDNNVVLLDEPFSALDALTRKDLQAWFLAMLTELDLSAMLVTHDVDEAVAMADRVLVLGSQTPGAARPSTIVGEVEVACPRSDRADFVLSSEALALKRQVIALLG